MKKSEKISKTTKKIFKVELFFFREKKQHRARGEPLLLSSTETFQTILYKINTIAFQPEIRECQGL